jgi:hypothetical protein
VADYSNLQALHVSDETLAEYVWDAIPGEPSLWLAPATDANPSFQSERLRVSIKRAEEARNAPQRRGAVLTADDIEADRELDRVLIARCCAKRWGTPPLDVNGNAPEFSEAECYSFFKALPNFLFDPLRGFASSSMNFVDKGKVAAMRRKITDGQARELGNS